MNKEKRSINQQPKQQDNKSPMKIPYDPDSLENITRRAERLHEIVKELEAAKNVPHEVMLKEFEV